MAGEPPKTPSKLTLSSLLRRPIEYGLIGAVAVLVIALADRLEVLPLKLKGLGTEVEFGTNEKETLNDTAAQIAQLEAQVGKLQSDLAEVVENIPAQAQFNLTAEAVRAAPEDRGNVSRAILAQDEMKTGQGIIWLGTFDPRVADWTDKSVVEPGGVLSPPSGLQAREVQLEIDVNLREDLPELSDEYYQGVAKLGVVPAGTKATIISQPQLYERATGNQYWAKVETTFKVAPD